MSTFELSIVTPTGNSLLSNVKSLSGDTTGGRFTVLAKHENYLFALEDSSISICFEDDERRQFLVAGAVLRVDGGSYILTAEKIMKLAPKGDVLL